jgi:3-hydroxyacyl-[acyl-carrier-protein] dehydratase
MRWFLIDRFVEFVSGEYAVATKNVSLAEECVIGQLPGIPFFPNPLVLEGMAQTGGMLLGELSQYRSRLVLAKVPRVKFFFSAQAGDTLRYTARIAQASTLGARLSATSHVNDNLQAEAEIFLAALPDRHEADELFQPSDFARLLRLVRIYEVGRTPQGQPLQMPEALARTESE